MNWLQGPTIIGPFCGARLRILLLRGVPPRLFDPETPINLNTETSQTRSFSVRRLWVFRETPTAQCSSGGEGSVVGAKGLCGDHPRHVHGMTRRTKSYRYPSSQAATRHQLKANLRSVFRRNAASGLLNISPALSLSLSLPPSISLHLFLSLSISLCLSPALRLSIRSRSLPHLQHKMPLNRTSQTFLSLLVFSIQSVVAHYISSL